MSIHERHRVSLRRLRLVLLLLRFSLCAAFGAAAALLAPSAALRRLASPSAQLTNLLMGG